MHGGTESPQHSPALPRRAGGLSGARGRHKPLILGGNANVEFLLDGVMHNANGSLSAMLPVPEPGALALAPLAGAALLRRVRGRKWQ